MQHELAKTAKAEGILRRLAGRDIELVTEYDPDLGLVRAEPSQIEEVLLSPGYCWKSVIARAQCARSNLQVKGERKVSWEKVLPAIAPPLWSRLK